MKVEDYLKRNKLNIVDYINRLLKKSLVVAIIVLTILIISKTNTKFKERIKDIVYKENINFSKVNKIYNDYILKIKDIKDNALQTVSKEKNLIYEEKKDYLNGVLLKTNKGYTIKALNSGLICFIGKKDDMDSIIIEQSNGINVIYSNIDVHDLKVYDYIEKDRVLGQTNNDYLYLSFYKDDEVLDYRPYIEN